MFRRTSCLIVAIIVAGCAADQPADREAASSEEAPADAPATPAAGGGAATAEEEPLGDAGAAGLEEGLVGAVEILEPGDGAVVGPDVRVTLNAVGVQVEPATSTRVPGRGHLHLLVDQDLTTAGQPIPAGVPGIVHMGDGSTEYSLTGLAPGEHQLIAVLGYGNHVPMDRVATDTIRIVVQEP